MNLSEIDTSIIEGRLLMAALAKLTTESQTDKEPDQVLGQCERLAAEMFNEHEMPDSPALCGAGGSIYQ